MRKGKPRIMHIIGSLVPGGVEKMFLATLEGLQERGNTENIGCVISDRLDILDESTPVRIISLGVPRTEFYPLRALLKFLEAPLLLYTILKENPDILYAYHNTDDKLIVVLLGWLLEKKVVIRKNMEERFTPRISQLISPAIYSLCDAAVTLFHDGEAELEAMGIKKEKIVHIPNGKDASAFGRGPSRRTARKRLGLRENGFVIGMVSRLDPIKNHQVIIRALQWISDEPTDITFAIVGDGPSEEYKEGLIRLIKEEGLERNVIFLGHRDDIEGVLPAFDVFVHPSLSDGLPGSVLEAMFAGLPIVASDVGGTKDLLQGCGVLLDPEDWEGYAKSIRELMLDGVLRNECGESASKRAQRLFSLEGMLKSYERLFGKLMS